MAAAEKPTTIVSTKGQVILPKAVRQRHRWDAATRLVVEGTPDGVLLRPAALFPAKQPREVFASLAYAGVPKSLTEMQIGSGRKQG